MFLIAQNDIKLLKAERDAAVRGWRRDAVKKHRAMPYAI